MSKTTEADPAVPTPPDVSESIDALRAAIARRNAGDDALSQKAFDHLYEELKQYKDDFIFQAEKPLLLDLLLFYDSVNWFQQSLINKEMSPDVIGDSFQYIIDELLEVLYRRDVLPMGIAERFSRETQKVIKTVPAEAKNDDYRIHQVLKRGFTRGGRVLRAEEVVVKRFTDQRTTKD
jgi:molecular chaperone GrpE (heat shock protein)